MRSADMDTPKLESRVAAAAAPAAPSARHAHVKSRFNEAGVRDPLFGGEAVSPTTARLLLAAGLAGAE